MFSARFMDAQESLQMGLINRICEAQTIEAEVREYARLVAANAPLTVRAAKVAINEAMRDPDQRDLDRIAAMIDECFNSEDYREGRRAFMEKRRPKFRGV